MLAVMAPIRKTVKRIFIPVFSILTAMRAGFFLKKLKKALFADCILLITTPASLIVFVGITNLKCHNARISYSRKAQLSNVKIVIKAKTRGRFPAK
jgi:hypothetical protein